MAFQICIISIKASGHHFICCGIFIQKMLIYANCKSKCEKNNYIELISGDFIKYK